MRISAYFRKSCFCSHRLFVFKEWDKSVSYFCPTFFFFEISEKTDFWTSFIRESVANLIFRFVLHSLYFQFLFIKYLEK
nr:hypothetical protein [Enterococcus durans]